MLETDHDKTYGDLDSALWHRSDRKWFSEWCLLLKHGEICSCIMSKIFSRNTLVVSAVLLGWHLHLFAVTSSIQIGGSPVHKHQNHMCQDNKLSYNIKVVLGGSTYTVIIFVWHFPMFFPHAINSDGLDKKCIPDVYF